MTLSKYFSAFTILGALTLSAPAWADVPPEDLCMESSVGQSCNNAMNDGKWYQAGVCKAAMCTRATPDGPLTYDCFRCEPLDDGTGGQSNEPGSAGAGGEPESGGNTAGAPPVEPPVGGSAGSPASSTAGAGTGGTPGTAGAKSGSNAADAPSSSDDGGGCSVAQARGGGALASLLTLLGFAFAGLRRRRSLTS